MNQEGTVGWMIKELYGYPPYLLMDYPKSKIHLIFSRKTIRGTCYYEKDMITLEGNEVKIWLRYANIGRDVGVCISPDIGLMINDLSKCDANERIRFVFPPEQMDQHRLLEGVLVSSSPYECQGSLCFKIRED